MSSGASWVMGMNAIEKRKADLMSRRAEKHRRIMKSRKLFRETFKTDIRRFYKDVFLGFDQLEFDDYLMTQDEQYRKANEGELGEDVDCSMETHILTKYGDAACRMIRSFI